MGQEMAMGASAFSDIRRPEPISTDAEATAMVERVGRRIAQQAHDHMPGAEWEFVLFDGDDTINAFALPGGKVGVYTGLLRVAETEDALATVIGHEIAHVTARHGTERMSTMLGLSALGVGIGVAGRDLDPGTRDAIMIAYGVVGTVGVALPHSRRAESEADEIGILYAARAGYDPRAAIGFWERMSAESAGRAAPPEFLSTHPSDETRIARLRELMPQAMAEYRAAGGTAP
jgi:metalloendopeptidase OMA1, mitochondrial